MCLILCWEVNGIVENDHSKKDKRHISVSKAIVPLLKGSTAEAIKKDFSRTKLRPYSDEERSLTDKKVEEVLLGRNR